MTSFSRIKLLALDCDKTVRHSLKDPDGFIEDFDDIAIYPAVPERVGRAILSGYCVAFISNQGGVAYGHKTYEEASLEMMETTRLVGRAVAEWSGATGQAERMLARFFLSVFAPCMPGGSGVFGTRSFLRKPHYGMLAALEVQALQQGHVIDWEESLYVGDREEDRDMALAAGVRFMWAQDWRMLPAHRHPAPGVVPDASISPAPPRQRD